VTAFRAFVLLLLGAFVPVARAAEPVAIGETQHIHSAVLNEDRGYQVHLPASYRWAADRRYPVLYVLDGRAHFVHTVAATDFLAAQGEIPETIVVAIASTVRVRDFTQTDWPQAWVGGGGAANFKRFLSTELIPAVEKAYRTDGFRILSGHSAGGQFALYCLTSDPSLFRAYFAFSSSLDWDDRLPVKSLKKALESARTLAAYVYVAREDDSGQALADYDSLVAALGSRKIPGFRFTSEAFPDERHSSTPLRGQIHALKALYAGYWLPEGLAEKGLPAVEAHYEGVSRTLGWPTAVPEDAINELAYAALEQKKTDEAIALFKRNADANPGSASAWDGLADGYAKAGRWREAASASDRSVELGAAYDHPDLVHFRSRAKKWHGKVDAEVPAPR
jgi:predicted alpha/beta superfamily hydrolase